MIKLDENRNIILALPGPLPTVIIPADTTATVKNEDAGLQIVWMPFPGVRLSATYGISSLLSVGCFIDVYYLNIFGHDVVSCWSYRGRHFRRVFRGHEESGCERSNFATRKG